MVPGAFGVDGEEAARVDELRGARGVSDLRGAVGVAVRHEHGRRVRGRPERRTPSSSVEQRARCAGVVDSHRDGERYTFHFVTRLGYVPAGWVTSR